VLCEDDVKLADVKAGDRVKRRTLADVAALALLTLLFWVAPAMVSQGSVLAPLPLDPALRAADHGALAEADALALALAAAPEAERAAGVRSTRNR
jgi:hypothetical protein